MCGSSPSILAKENKDYRKWPQYCRKTYWTKMVQYGPNDHFVQMTLFRTDFSIRETKMDHFLTRSILVHLGPPTVLWPFLRCTPLNGFLQDRRVRFRCKTGLLSHRAHVATACLLQRAAKGRQKEFDHFVLFLGLFRWLIGHIFWYFCHFFVTFLLNSFCRTPFAAGWANTVLKDQISISIVVICDQNVLLNRNAHAFE